MAYVDGSEGIEEGIMRYCIERCNLTFDEYISYLRNIDASFLEEENFRDLGRTSGELLKDLYMFVLDTLIPAKRDVFDGDTRKMQDFVERVYDARWRLRVGEDRYNRKPVPDDYAPEEEADVDRHRGIGHVVSRAFKYYNDGNREFTREYCKRDTVQSMRERLKPDLTVIDPKTGEIMRVEVKSLTKPGTTFFMEFLQLDFLQEDIEGVEGEGFIDVMSLDGKLVAKYAAIQNKVVYLPDGCTYGKNQQIPYVMKRAKELGFQVVNKCKTRNGSNDPFIVIDYNRSMGIMPAVKTRSKRKVEVVKSEYRCTEL
jgi:hypothetical protein